MKFVTLKQLHVMCTSELRSSDYNLSLSERIKDVCVLSILGGRQLTITAMLCWGACLDNLMSSNFPGSQSRLMLQKPPLIQTHLFLL